MTWRCSPIAASNSGIASRPPSRSSLSPPGIPWLGFVIWPDHLRVKGRKVVEATRRLSDRFDDWRSGLISFAEFDVSVQGWLNHVRYADSWGLRRHMLDRFARQQ
jgi:hypothetical protein